MIVDDTVAFAERLTRLDHDVIKPHRATIIQDAAAGAIRVL